MLLFDFACKFKENNSCSFSYDMCINNNTCNAPRSFGAARQTKKNRPQLFDFWWFE